MYNLISDDYGVLSYGKLFFLGGVVLFLIGCIEFTLKAWFASNEEIENKLRNTFGVIVLGFIFLFSCFVIFCESQGKLQIVKLFASPEQKEKLGICLKSSKQTSFDDGGGRFYLSKIVDRCKEQEIIVNLGE